MLMKNALIMFFYISTAFVSAEIDTQEAQEKKSRLEKTIACAQAGLEHRYKIDIIKRDILSLKKQREDASVNLSLVLLLNTPDVSAFENRVITLRETELFAASDTVISVVTRTEGGLELRREDGSVVLVLEQYTLSSDRTLLEIHIAQVLSRNPYNPLVRLIQQYGRDQIIEMYTKFIFQLGQKIHELSEQLETMQS